MLKDIITVFPDAAKYTMVQLLVDCGIILQEGPEYKLTNIISLVDLLHYHSRRLVYILHVTRFSQLPVTAKCSKNRRGTVRHTKLSNIFLIEKQLEIERLSLTVI